MCMPRQLDQLIMQLGIRLVQFVFVEQPSALCRLRSDWGLSNTRLKPESGPVRAPTQQPTRIGMFANFPLPNAKFVCDVTSITTTIPDMTTWLLKLFIAPVSRISKKEMPLTF